MSTQPAVAVKPGRDELDKERANLLILFSVTLDAILILFIYYHIFVGMTLQ